MLDKLFRPRPADGMVLVLGLGRFGIACARRLQELGMDVLGVDADLDLVNRYADTLRHVVRMDSTDADALRQLGLENVGIAIVSMAHLGPRAFDSIGGEVVSTTAFVLENTCKPDYRGAYLRLVDGNSEAEKMEMMAKAIAQGRAA